MNRRRFLKTALMSAACPVVGKAADAPQFNVQQFNSSIVDKQALTIQGRFGQVINGLAFQQHALLSFAGHQYVSWYNGKRQVCVGRRKLPNGQWETVRFDDYEFHGNDAHDTISLGICPADGTVHLSFDHHGDPLRYRVSKAGVATSPDETQWTSHLFGPVIHELREGHQPKVTYPRFITCPDGRLQFFYRDGRGTRRLHTYDPARGGWSAPRPIIADNGYTNYHTCYGPKNRLHLFWHWRGSGRLCYLYSSDKGRTWRKNDGEIVLRENDGKAVGKKDMHKVTVLGSSSATFMMLGGQYIDSKGRPHEIVWHIPDGVQAQDFEHDWQEWGRPQARYHHYWRDHQGTWHSNILPGPVGSRAKILLDSKNNAYAVYTVNKTDDWDWQIYFSQGELVIATATAASGWTDWKIIHREPGPFLNEMLFDDSRWRSDGVLSLLAQNSPNSPGESTILRVLDLKIEDVPLGNDRD